MSHKNSKNMAIFVAPIVFGLSLVVGADAALAQNTPTNRDFIDAATDAANWILPSKSYTANHYTVAAQITPENVANLRPAWTFKLSDDNGPMETSPIIFDNTMYVTSAHDHIYALDAATGHLKWEFKYNPHVISFAANRGIGLFDGNVYIATLDGHLIALNAATGQKVWDKITVSDTSNSFYTMAPVPYHNPTTGQDMLILGVSNGDWGGLGNIAAYDPKDGHLLWKWQTIPRPGQAGNNTWSGDSWKRGGGSVWGGATINTATQTLYIDVGNPGPDFLGAAREGANLYTDSMVALDISGLKPKLKWYHQFIPHDTHDWDPAMQPVLFNGVIDGHVENLVAAGDKGGNFWVLNANTGKLVDHTAVSFQKGHNTEPTETGDIACPNTLGGVEYQGGAFGPDTNTFYLPSQDECGRWVVNKAAVYISGQFYTGGGWPQIVGPTTGQLNAIDVSNGIFDWRHYFGLPNYGGALATASGLVFSGNLGGEEDAFNAKTGHLLWSYNTGSYIQAPSEAYEDNGKEYIVVTSGTAGNASIPALPNPSNQEAIVTSFTIK